MPAHDEWLTLWIGLNFWFAFLVGQTGFLTVRARMAGANRESVAKAHWNRRVVGGIAVVILACLSWLRTEGGFENYADWIEDNGDWTASSQPATWLNANLPTTEAIADRTDLRWFRLYPADLREAELTRKPPGWLPFDIWLDAFEVEYRARPGNAEKTDLRTDRAFIAEATQRYNAPLSTPDLKDADLRNADLTSAFLPGADLRRAQMQGADLRRAQMQGAYLSEAQMQGADLRGAQMQGTDLGGAKMQGADLRWAEMQGADLHRAKMQGADLRGARLDGANLENAELQGAELNCWGRSYDERCTSLQGAVLLGAKMQGADLHRANMQGADLRGAKMKEADLSRAKMKEAFLNGAEMQGAFLGGAEMQGAFLLQAKMQGADLSRANMQGAFLFQAEMQGAFLFQAKMQGANLSGAKMQGAVLVGAQMQDADCSSATLRDALLQSANVTCRNLTQAQLAGAVGNLETVLPRGLTVASCLETLHKDVEAALAHHPEEGNQFRASRAEVRDALLCGEGEKPHTTGTTNFEIYIQRRR